eukprot:12685397-Alexandrium_andersonii.AAC.1
METLPIVGKLALSNVSHHHTCPDRARKTRPDLAGQTRRRQDRVAADSCPAGCNHESVPLETSARAARPRPTDRALGPRGWEPLPGRGAAALPG